MYFVAFPAQAFYPKIGKNIDIEFVSLSDLLLDVQGGNS